MSIPDARLRPDLSGSTWFGPMLIEPGMRVVASSSGLHLPPGSHYRVTATAFAEDGQLISSQRIADVQPREPVLVDVATLTDLTETRGMLALTHRELNDDRRPVTEPWTLRFVSDDGVQETIVAESPPMINAKPGSTPFRLTSSEAYVGEGWSPVAVVHNASVDPGYQRHLTLDVVVFDANGRSMQAGPIQVPPFGTAWIDLLELCGSDLVDLLAPTGLRGSYTIASREGSGVGYHLLRNSSVGGLAADHTRPMLRYISRGYGTTRYGARKGLVPWLAGTAQYLNGRFQGARR